MCEWKREFKESWQCTCPDSPGAGPRSSGICCQHSGQTWCLCLAKQPWWGQGYMGYLKPVWELELPFLMSNTPVVWLHLRSAVLVTKDKVCQVYVHTAPTAKDSEKVKEDHDLQLHSEMGQSVELQHGPFWLSAVSFFHRYTVLCTQYCLELLMTWLQLGMVDYIQDKEEVFVYTYKGTDLPGFRLLVNSFLYRPVQHSTIWIGISWWKQEIYHGASNLKGSS